MDYCVEIGERRIRVEIVGSSFHVDGPSLDVELGSKSGISLRSIHVGDCSLRVIPKENGCGDWTFEVEPSTERDPPYYSEFEAAQKAALAVVRDRPIQCVGERGARSTCPGYSGKL